jgi:hypothetical protein
LNVAFGGYEAAHYLAATLSAGISEIPFDEEVVRISKSISAEMFNSSEKECILMSRNTVAFNKRCVNYMKCDYVEILLHPQERLLAVRKTSAKNPNAIPLTTKTISSTISRVIYDLMGWRRDFRHRIVADIFAKDGQSVLFFNLGISEYCKNAKRLLTTDWLNSFEDPPGKRLLLTRLLLSQSMSNWEIGARAIPVKGFDTDVPETGKAEREKLIEELRREYVGWQQPERADNRGNRHKIG